jgi:hypothetical protein
MVQVLVGDVDMRASYGRSADETGQLSEAVFTFLLCTSSFLHLEHTPTVISHQIRLLNSENLVSCHSKAPLEVFTSLGLSSATILINPRVLRLPPLRDHVVIYNFDQNTFRSELHRKP